MTALPASSIPAPTARRPTEARRASGRFEADRSAVAIGIFVVATAVLLTGFASLIWDFPLVRLPVWAFGVGDLAFRLGGTRPVGIYLVYVGLVLSLSAAAQYTVIARREYRDAVAATLEESPDRADRDSHSADDCEVSAT